MDKKELLNERYNKMQKAKHLSLCVLVILLCSVVCYFYMEFLVTDGKYIVRPLMAIIIGNTETEARFILLLRVLLFLFVIVVLPIILIFAVPMMIRSGPTDQYLSLLAEVRKEEEEAERARKRAEEEAYRRAQENFYRKFNSYSREDQREKTRSENSYSGNRSSKNISYDQDSPEWAAIVLGLDKMDFTEEELRHAYRDLIKRFASDVTKNPKDDDKMKRINHAREILEPYAKKVSK